MKYISNYANATDETLWFIKLHPETDHERALLNGDGNNEEIEAHYHRAVDQIPGGEYDLLSIVDTSQWPFAALARVQKIGGLGR